MYRQLAKYYDTFNSAVDYTRLADEVSAHISGEGVDFGCGTGKLTVALAKKGYKITGVDLSAEMLGVAAENASGSGVTFVKGDITKFEFLKPVDFALAICDTLNYVKDPRAAIRNVYCGLADGGTFVFDISSEYELKNVLAGNTFSDETDGATYIWQCSPFYKNSVQMTLTFFENVGNGMYVKSTDTQVQYAHKTEDIMTYLKESGFRADAYADLTKKGITSKTQRIYFIAKKG